MEERLQIEEKSRPLVHPGEDYFSISLKYRPLVSAGASNGHSLQSSRPVVSPSEDYISLNLDDETSSQFGDLSFSGDLVPRLVKLELKEALKKVIEREESLKLKRVKGEFAVTLK